MRLAASRRHVFVVPTVFVSWICCLLYDSRLGPIALVIQYACYNKSKYNPIHFAPLSITKHTSQ